VQFCYFSLVSAVLLFQSFISLHNGELADSDCKEDESKCGVDGYKPHATKVVWL
jgi:hypothetical protein